MAMTTSSSTERSIFNDKPSAHPNADPNSDLDDPTAPHAHLLHLLRTAHVPTPAERQSTLLSLSHHRHALTTISKQLTHLHAVIAALHLRQTHIETTISLSTALLSPVRTLPDEILGEIFLFAAGGDVDVCNPRSAVWVFERVCRRWRGVALGLGELWSRIDICMDSMTLWKRSVDVSTVRRLVRRCLERSGSRGRGLGIKFSETGDPKSFGSVWGVLEEARERWEELEFSLSMLEGVGSNVTRETNIRYPVSLPNLHTLRLSGYLRPPLPPSPSPTLPLALFHAPRLTHLRLFGIPRPFVSLSLPWGQLTHFTSEICEYSTKKGELMRMLREMIGLRVCILRWNRAVGGERDIVPTNAGGGSILLKHLHTLKIEAPLTQCMALLGAFYVPSLRNLTIQLPASSADRSPSSQTLIHSLALSNSILSPSLTLSTTLIQTLQRSIPVDPKVNGNKNETPNHPLTSLSLLSVDAPGILHLLASPPLEGLRDLELTYLSDLPGVLRGLVIQGEHSSTPYSYSYPRSSPPSHHSKAPPGNRNKNGKKQSEADSEGGDEDHQVLTPLLPSLRTLALHCKHDQAQSMLEPLVRLLRASGVGPPSSSVLSQTPSASLQHLLPKPSCASAPSFTTPPRSRPGIAGPQPPLRSGGRKLHTLTLTIKETQPTVVQRLTAVLRQVGLETGIGIWVHVVPI